VTTCHLACRRGCGLVVALPEGRLGWWWADPLAPLAIAGVALKEGRDAWRGPAYCDTC
jgi:divalent metal cation (Fe/Co/Zn/Cd) transporter